MEVKLVTRRDFLKLTGAGVVTLFSSRCAPFRLLGKAPIPGGTLRPSDVRKFVTPLLIPPVMPRAGTLTQEGQAEDYYEISMRQIEQQILPDGLPATTVWGYGAVTSESKAGLLLHHAPSLTIEATTGRHTRIKWMNELVGATGQFLPHLLPVDPTLHWANPGGGTAGRDTRPSFTETPGRYTGPVPIVTHVHGAVGVGQESDGYPEAWYLPAANNIPEGYAREGTWYSYFAKQARGSFGAEWGPGFATFEYPNENRASTIWYHDHALGMTRLNVYAGPAGFYILRGGPSGDEAVLDSRTGTKAVLPGPAPRDGDPFPASISYFEIPIAIQDRAFNADGSLFYPDTRVFFDEFKGPYLPANAISPIWNPEFFGNISMVNGNTWPYLDVEQRRYRLRFLNGCDSRFLILDFSNMPGVEVWQIGNEGGFLPAAVNLSADHDNKLIMALAERADVIVDFTHVRPGHYVLVNAGPDEPFNGGPFEAADDQSTGQIMQFRVKAAGSSDPSTPPQFLALPAVPLLPPSATTRPLALLEQAETIAELDFEGPSAAMLGVVDADGMPAHHMWSDAVTENPEIGDTETWEFYNFTADAHPMHVHEVTFEVVNRQELATDEEGMTTTPAQLTGEPRAPEPWEAGRKDTVIAYPGQVTRIRAHFEKGGQFVWHCHIVSHEDNEMMRPYRIGPADPDAPSSRHNM
jgi:FtsP/CotA-like multicopper oxidase with cupredoxin domain